MKKINNVDVWALKNKLGGLLNHLYFDAGISKEMIQYKMIFSSVLDYFENNDVDSFLGTSDQEIIQSLFEGETQIDYSKINPVFLWAGYGYIDLSIKLSTPIKTIFLLLPLNEMLSLFEPYHEMSFSHLKDYYLENCNTRSVFESIRSYSSYSRKEVCILAGIKEKTLPNYIYNNKALFNSSFKTIIKLSKLFSCPLDLFKEESSFIPFSFSFMEKEEFVNKLLDSLFLFYPKFKNRKVRFILDQNKTYSTSNEKDAVSFDFINLCFIEGKIKTYIKEEIFNYALGKACRDFYKI